MATSVNVVTFTLVGDGATSIFDIDLADLPKEFFAVDIQALRYAGIYGSVSLDSGGSWPVTVTTASLAAGILHIELNTTVHNNVLYTVSASLKYPLA